MTRRILLLLCQLLLVFGLFAQSRPVPDIIRHLLSQKKSIPVVTGWLNDFLPANTLPHQLRKEVQFLYHTSTGLYLGIDGTGRVYEVDEVEGNLAFRRIDSTFYMGHNFCAANFTVGDTLFSFGGYGFWKNNGLLRRYNPDAHEWMVEKMDREVCARSCSDKVTQGFWVDPASRNMYLQGTSEINNSIRQSIDQSKPESVKLMKLDLEKGEWAELGDMGYFEAHFRLNSPWGLLNSYADTCFVNDFIHNRKLLAKSSTLRRIMKMYTHFPVELAYFVDSTLYLGNLYQNTFDSIPLSRADFEYLGAPVYVKSNSFARPAGKNALYPILLVSLLLLLLFVYIAFWKKRKALRLLQQAILQEAGETRGAAGEAAAMLAKSGASWQGNLFSEVEKELISYIYKITLSRQSITVHEINKVLGLAGKNESVQKKNRSETINQVNEKWLRMNGGEQPLIVRRRSEMDKRSFDYFIHPTWHEQASRLIAGWTEKV